MDEVMKNHNPILKKRLMIYKKSLGISTMHKSLLWLNHVNDKFRSFFLEKY